MVYWTGPVTKVLRNTVQSNFRKIYRTYDDALKFFITYN